VPGWGYEEITHSKHRAQYVFSIPQPLFILDVEKDYLPHIEYHSLKLMKVFASACSPASKPHRYLKKRLC
jgi:hypothetical protein